MAFPQVNVYLCFDEAGKHFYFLWPTPCVGLLTRVCSVCLVAILIHIGKQQTNFFSLIKCNLSAKLLLFNITGNGMEKDWRIQKIATC